MTTPLDSLSGDSAAPKRVLLVDADHTFVREATEWLTLEGFEVVAASEFSIARAMLTTQVPDILISDVRLGAFNGLHLVLMSKAERPNLRAIVLTRYDDPVLRDAAAQAGARFLVKPISRDALLDAIKPAALAATP